MKKQAALIERAWQLRAWLEACQPEDRLRHMSLLVELVIVIEQLLIEKEKLPESKK